MTNFIYGDPAEAAKYLSTVKHYKTELVRQFGKTNKNMQYWRQLSDTAKVHLRLINGQPRAYIYAGGIGITLKDKQLDTGKRLFLTTQKTLDSAASIKSNFCGYYYWVNREKSRTVSVATEFINWAGHYYSASFVDSIPEAVCLIPEADSQRLKQLHDNFYNAYCYGFFSSNSAPGSIRLLALYKEGADYVCAAAGHPLTLPWVTSGLGALAQWHDSGAYCLKSFFSYDLSNQANTDKTSVIATVIGTTSGVKQANSVQINKFIPYYDDAGLTVNESIYCQYVLYDQIKLTGNTGTQVSTGINAANIKEFPGCSKASYILPLGMDQDVLGFYVTEVKKADYSETTLTNEDHTTSRTVEFTYNVSAAMTVMDIYSQAVIEKIAFKDINKHQLIKTSNNEPDGPVVISEDIAMDFITPLYMNTQFKVFLYLKSRYASDRVLTNGEVTKGAIIRTHDLCIHYHGYEQIVAAGTVKKTGFQFPGEAIIKKSTGGDRIELFPDIVMFPSAHTGDFGNIFANNGVGLYGADFKDQLVISLNRNQQTLFLENNDDDSVIELLGKHTWIFTKTLKNPEEPDKYSYGVNKFDVELTDESHEFYADSMIEKTGSTIQAIKIFNITPTVVVSS